MIMMAQTTESNYSGRNRIHVKLAWNEVNAVSACDQNASQSLPALTATFRGWD